MNIKVYIIASLCLLTGITHTTQGYLANTANSLLQNALLTNPQHAEELLDGGEPIPKDQKAWILYNWTSKISKISNETGLALDDAKRIIDKLVQKGAEVNSDIEGCPALIGATKDNNPAIAQHLVERHHANPKCMDKTGKNSLYYAVDKPEMKELFESFGYTVRS